MRGQPRDLLAVQIRHAQEVSVRRRPDGLDHVPEIEPSGRKRVLPQDRERREACDPGGGAGDQERT